MVYDTTSGRSPVDPELSNLIEKEERRRPCELDLSSAEGFTSFPLNEAARTTNFIFKLGDLPNDALVNLCRRRGLQAYGLNPDDWGVNVQSYSGFTALNAACTTLVPSCGRIMGLDLTSEIRAAPRFNTSGTMDYFAIIPFVIDRSTGLFNYTAIEEQVQNFQPHLIVCGGIAYPRDWDYSLFRRIADNHNALLLCDMTNISGLVAAQQAANPFEYCQIVTTTYKSLEGSTVGLIFYRKDQPNLRDLFASADNTPVLPSPQGGQHNGQICALAFCLNQVISDDFKAYARKVKANAVALGDSLVSKGHKLVTNGTDNHLVLWDLRPLGLAGSKVEKLCHRCGITVKKNAIFGGGNARVPRGILIGTHPMTSTGMEKEDFEKIGEFLHQAVSIALSIQKQHGRKMSDFNKGLDNNKDIKALKDEVDQYSHYQQLAWSRDSKMINATQF